MHYYVGVTDYTWFTYLRSKVPEDVNFWKPNDTQTFHAIEKGAPFLFKLRAPYNAIGGVGFFSAFAHLTLPVAWNAFGQRNGCDTLDTLRSMILKYRSSASIKTSSGPMVIGCIILTNPIFFEEHEYIDAPLDWAKNIVSGKGYDDTTVVGKRLWEAVQERLYLRSFYQQPEVEDLDSDPFEQRYRDTLSKVRIGQGAFRVMVSEAYNRSCAVTGDHTLPALEAAHIQSYADKGPNSVSNGLLLRSDLHKLYDSGYLTITPDYRVEVSPLLKQEFHNGKIYYEMHGKRLVSLPSEAKSMPDPRFLQWHNEHIYQS